LILIDNDKLNMILENDAEEDVLNQAVILYDNDSDEKETKTDVDINADDRLSQASIENYNEIEKDSISDEFID